MAVPKFRISASKRDMRRAHHALKATSFAYCTACGEAKLAHTVCKNCGNYKGKVVVQPKVKGDLGGEDFNVEG
ncbi:MAG: 50S ribosomal protein L32 [Deltaproteobacteria bacterium]|nr:50S ribosomal protein L32 [Deltaproteobacteria bacterium]